jgi:hypothetical protein
MACDRPASTRTALARAQALASTYDSGVHEAALALLVERRVIVAAGSLLVALPCVPEEARAVMPARLRAGGAAGPRSEASPEVDVEMVLSSEELS